MNKTYNIIKLNDKTFNLLALPNSNYFKFEIVNKFGSNVERIYNQKNNTDIYGISHLIEHLSFRNSKHFSSSEINSLLQNEGNHNASTSYGQINYWFETISSNIDLAIKLVTDITFNDLKNISQKEFELEKNVVYNEVKGYLDDDETMFYLDNTRTVSNYNKYDNIIGNPENILNFTLDNCINVKDTFLQNDDIIYNITYDPQFISENEIINKINIKINEFNFIKNDNFISKDEYLSFLKYPINKNNIISNDNQQFMTNLIFDNIDDDLVAKNCNSYLTRYAKNTSLNQIIREEHGLTYGVDFSIKSFSYKKYSSFNCNVSNENSQILLKLFKESINKSIDNFDEEACYAFNKTKNLKINMGLINQKLYNSWHHTATWKPDFYYKFKDVFNNNIDDIYGIINEHYSNFEIMKKYFEKLKVLVNSDDYFKVTNKEIK